MRCRWGNRISILVIVVFIFSFIAIAQDKGNVFVDLRKIPAHLKKRYIEIDVFPNPYLLCVAMASNDYGLLSLMSKDKKAKESYSRLCMRLNQFYYPLITQGLVTTQICEACSNASKQPLEQCQKWAEAFLARDPTICSQTTIPNECKAEILRDENYCEKNDNRCQGMVYFLQAAEKKNVRLCDKISDEETRMICKGIIAKDTAICTECESFKKFIGFYNREQKKSSQQNIDTKKKGIAVK